MHVAVPERVADVENLADWLPVSHVLLDAEVGDAQVDVECSAKETGDRSPAPWEPERTPYRSANEKIRRRWVMLPACDTEVRM